MQSPHRLQKASHNVNQPIPSFSQPHGSLSQPRDAINQPHDSPNRSHDSLTQLPHTHETQFAPRRKRAKRKCTRCREKKQKCLPHDRNWARDGQKCDRCHAAGQPCGPSMTVKEEEDQKLPQTAQTNPAGLNSGLRLSLGPLHGHERGDPGDPTVSVTRARGNVEDLELSSGGESRIDTSGLQYCKVFGRRHLGDNVNKWLQKLGYLSLFHTCLESTQDTPVLPAYLSSGHFNTLQFALKKTVEEVEFTIEKLGKFAANFALEGDDVAADRVFGRLLDNIQCSPYLNVKLQHLILSKMARFYRGIEDDPQLQKILHILSSLENSNNLNLDIRSHEILAPLILANSRLMSEIYANGILPEISPPVHSPALHQSVRYENHRVFTAVLEAAKEPQIISSRSQLASGSCVLPLDQNQDMEGRDTLQQTPLFVACSRGNERFCRDLIQAGAKVNNRDCHGRSMLEVAAGKGALGIVQLLIDSGAKVNPRPVRDASTPLHAAAEGAHIDVVRLLLSKGADVGIGRCCDSKTAAQVALEMGHHAIAQELEMSLKNGPQTVSGVGISQGAQSVDQWTPPDSFQYIFMSQTGDIISSQRQLQDWTPMHLDGAYPHGLGERYQGRTVDVYQNSVDFDVSTGTGR